MRQAVSDEKVKVGIGRSKSKISKFLPASGDTRRIAQPLHELIHKAPYTEKADQILKPINKSPKRGHEQNQGKVGLLPHNGLDRLNNWKKRLIIAKGTIGKYPLHQCHQCRRIEGCIGEGNHRVFEYLYPNRENDFVQVVYFEK